MKNRSRDQVGKKTVTLLVCHSCLAF